MVNGGRQKVWKTKITQLAEIRTESGPAYVMDGNYKGKIKNKNIDCNINILVLDN